MSKKQPKDAATKDTKNKGDAKKKEEKGGAKKEGKKAGGKNKK